MSLNSKGCGEGFPLSSDSNEEGVAGSEASLLGRMVILCRWQLVGQDRRTSVTLGVLGLNVGQYML